LTKKPAFHFLETNGKMSGEDEEDTTPKEPQYVYVGMRQNGEAKEPKDSEKGRRNGNGTATFKDEQRRVTDIYEGAYDDDVRNGEGTYTWIFQPPAKPEGEDEDAEAEEGDADKPGLKEGDKVATYKGSYKANKKHGYGEFTYPAEDQTKLDKVGVYQGEWEGDSRNGKGLYRYANGDFYEGTWTEGLKEGFGRYLFNKEAGTGGYFEGDWVQNKMKHGKWVWKDGTTYQGQFDNNKPKGEGVWTFGKENGNMQVGNFVADGKWRSDLQRKEYVPTEDGEGGAADEEGEKKEPAYVGYWKGGRLSQINP
jgi:hypothetical protein